MPLFRSPSFILFDRRKGLDSVSVICYLIRRRVIYYRIVFNCLKEFKEDMMNEIIVYGSCYGTTRKYAEELSRRTGITAVAYKDIKDITHYQTVIYMGGLYAGGVEGMKKTLKDLTDISGKKIIIVTVGLADPADNQNKEHIRNNIRSQVSPDIYEKAQIFHLRGGIDYSALSLLHRTMMKMVYKKAVSVPEEEKTAEIRAMIETYNKQAYFVDPGSLDPVINAVTA